RLHARPALHSLDQHAAGRRQDRHCDSGADRASRSGGDAALSLPSSTAFDPKLAKSPTRVLPLDQVIDLLSVTHAPERVEEYRQAMLRGDRFPPVSVVKLAGRYFVADGHKRLCAYKTLGGGELVVEVWSIPRWLGDQQRQLSNNLRRQVPALFRAITG